MPLRINQQLFLSYLVLIGLLTLVMSVAAGSLLRNRLIASTGADLERELVLARALHDNSPELLPDSLARLIRTLTERNVVVVDTDGRVVGSSAGAAEPNTDYSLRPEIRSALDSGRGRALRRHGETGEEHLYIAISTEGGMVLRMDAPLAELEATLAAVQRRLAGAAAVAVLLAGLFSFGFSHVVTRPLRHIGAVARALAAGDLSRRARVHRDGELGELGSALDTLAEELQRRLGQLEGERAEMQALIDSMSEGVLAFTEVGRLRRTNPAARRMFALEGPIEGIAPEMVSRRPDFLDLVGAALDGRTVPPRELTGDGHSLRATAHPLPQGGAVAVFLDVSELRRLESVRREFVANASHELKTPLTAIRGFSETLLDPELPPELIRKFAEIVKQNSDRLQQIVDDLLDLSRIEAGAWQFEPAVVTVGDLARDVWAAQHARHAAEKDVELRLEIDSSHRAVHADPGGLRQVFTNLFSNALRYTPAGGSVTVRTGAAPRPGEARVAHPGGAEAGRWTLVEVTDTGAGIPTPHLTRIFERFYRADPARSREEGGTGLGLSIVKHIVESQGGWIEARSSVGEGTTIRFVLPSAPT